MPMFARAAGVHSRTHSHQADVGRQACTQVLLVLHTSCTRIHMQAHAHTYMQYAALHTRCGRTRTHVCALQVLLLLHTSCTHIPMQAHACNTQPCTLIVGAHRHTCELCKCCCCCTLIAHTYMYAHTHLAALHTHCGSTRTHECALQVLLLLHTSCTHIPTQAHAHACNTQPCTLIVAAHRHTSVLHQCCWCCTPLAHTYPCRHTHATHSLAH